MEKYYLTQLSTKLENRRKNKGILTINSEKDNTKTNNDTETY